MQIFFTCSYSGKKKYGKDFERVLESIKKHDVEVVTTEDKSYLREDHQAKQVPHLSWNESSERKYTHYNAIKREIYEADAVIIDATYPSFRLGHEATLAAQSRKPTLVVSRFRDYSNLVDYPNFFGAKYTHLTIDEIIEKFIIHAKKQRLSERFNLFMSPEQKSYLDQSAKDKNMNSSEYLRSLIERDMSGDI